MLTAPEGMWGKPPAYMQCTTLCTGTLMKCRGLSNPLHAQKHLGRQANCSFGHSRIPSESMSGLEGQGLTRQAASICHQKWAKAVYESMTASRWMPMHASFLVFLQSTVPNVLHSLRWMGSRRPQSCLAPTVSHVSAHWYCSIDGQTSHGRSGKQRTVLILQ